MNFKIAIIQMKVLEDKLINLKNAENYVREVAKEGTDLAVLPEMFNCPYTPENFPVYAESEGGKYYQSLSDIAKNNGIYLVAGSIPERGEKGEIFNTSYVFDRVGNQIGKHQKVHLFDIEVEGGQIFKESDTLTGGSSIEVFDTEFGKMGLAICYDFRFPEVSRILVDKGAKIIIIPAAFNMTTGPAHWEILFRTRALDNQVYTVGVAPAREEDSCYTSYGNSIVVSPWGDIIERMDEKEGYSIINIDMQRVEKVRQELPLLKHRRKDLYQNER